MKANKVKEIERNIGLMSEKLNVMKAAEEKYAAKAKEYNKALEKNKADLSNNQKQQKALEGQVQTHQANRSKLEADIQAGNAAFMDLNGRRDQIGQRMMAHNQQIQAVEAQCHQVR